MSTTVKKISNEFLTPLQRLIEFITIAGMLLLIGFLAYHQIADTGFFTDRFGSIEMASLYAPALLSLAAPLTRALSGHRNSARPFEAATNLFLAAGSLWLLSVFPFNYAHLADPLPDAIQFVLSWVTNDIAKLFFILQVIICPIAAIAIMWKYFRVLWLEPAHSSLP